jgi:uncharacterized membrane protein YdbT with pleckstrin-like domain
MDTSLRPDKLYLKKYVYFILLVTVIIYIFFVPFCLIIFKEGGPGLFILFLGTVGWLALGAIILLFSKLWIDRLSYIIKDSSITIYRGIFTKIEQNIPDNKVTDFVLYRDLFDRFLGMGSIKVQTAGASGQSGFEGVLNGILDYEKVHTNLREKLVSTQTSTESVKSTNVSNETVLVDILSELKDINKKLNN